MSTHTPGPWHVEDYAVYDSRQQLIARPNSKNLTGLQGPERHANARLIAAAPRMLKAIAALADLEKDGGTRYPTMALLAEARAIRRYVEGESNG